MDYIRGVLRASHLLAHTWAGRAGEHGIFSPVPAQRKSPSGDDSGNRSMEGGCILSAFRSTGFFLSANPCWNAPFFPGSLRQAEVFQDSAAHFPEANGRAAVGGKNIAGPEAPVQHRGDGGLNAVGLGGHIEGEAKHHSGGQNGADGVGKVPARDVRGGAVDGLVEPPRTVSQGAPVRTLGRGESVLCIS